MKTVSVVLIKYLKKRNYKLVINKNVAEMHYDEILLKDRPKNLIVHQTYYKV